MDPQNNLTRIIRIRVEVLKRIRRVIIIKSGIIFCQVEMRRNGNQLSDLTTVINQL